MKIREIINDYEGEFKAIEVYESTDGKRSFHTDHIAAVDDSEWMNDDEAVDYELMDEDDYNSSVCANSSESFGDSYEEGNKVLVILVQPKKVVTYIHVSAPAPQYAINSISKIRGAISLAATRTNCYAREKEDANRLTCDIILDISCDTSNAAEVIKEAHSYLVTWNSKKIARAYLLAMTDLITMLHTPKFSKLNRRGIGKFEAIDKPAAGGVPRYFFFQMVFKMKKDWKNARERNEANDAAIYERKGIELSRTIIPEDTSEYIICAFYPDTGETEILGVGTQAFGLKLGIKMDRDVNIIFL